MSTPQIPLGQAPQLVPPAEASTATQPGEVIPATQAQGTDASDSQTQTPEPTVPMFDKDGNIADIPQSRSAEAADKGGYKLGIPMIGKDGSKAVIPADRADEAMLKGGYTLENPNQPTTERAMQQTMGGPPMFVDVPVGDKDSFEKSGQAGYQKGGQIGAGLVIGGGIAATAATAVPTIVETAGDIATWAKANPVKALAIEGIAREIGVDPMQLLGKTVKYGKHLFGE